MTNPYDRPDPRGYATQPEYGYREARGYYQDDPRGHRQPPRRKRRVFLWVFLAIQALFVIWVIAGAATKTGAPASQVAAQCDHHAWFPLFKSQADCVTHFGGALNDAGNAGKAIGIGLIIVFWFIVDVILGVSYGVYKLATRPRQ